jgi:hypothetical protein
VGSLEPGSRPELVPKDDLRDVMIVICHNRAEAATIRKN